ncbi:Skb1 methyltransferase [Thozetella sp. PMI_491]|nr:Skb1 methyltransferase [Thozetella sp. PMI_491]
MMASGEGLNPESGSFQAQEPRPSFYIGQHDSSRSDTLADTQYSQVLNLGFNFVTTPITNQHFYERVVNLYKDHLAERQAWETEGRLHESQKGNPSLPGPIVPTLSNKDTSFFPTSYVGAVVAYSSPWIDLGSPNPIIASISRQVLNLEVAYANFCGARSIVIPGPRKDGNGRATALYARAVQEALVASVRANLIIHMPMYREPGLEEGVDTLTTVLDGASAQDAGEEIDLFGAWDSWNTVRSICEYSARLFVAIRIPHRLPEKNLQTRWFAEPLHYLTLGPQAFQSNKAGLPSLSKSHQEMINMYMRLKNAPWMILYDVGPDPSTLGEGPGRSEKDFPSLAESSQALKEHRKPYMPPPCPHLSYMRHLERQQPPYTEMESVTLTSFQDWLQSPLQPLSDNLESATYEMFEGDPVKYDQYEAAILEAMLEWKELKKPTSAVPSEAHPDEDLIVTVAGAGRGPLVTRVLRAAERTQTKIQLWALEKNQNAFVYLLRQNEREWGGKVTLVKTDMRGWEGPRPKGSPDTITKVDILVTELLGSFGDNELSPECLDGIQRHLAQPHGISIPHSYTAHLSPISSPRLFADITSRVVADPNAFEIPWVVRLFQIDFVAEKVPGHPRFQEAWEFIHPVGVSRADDFAAKHGLAAKFTTGGGGAMSGSSGTNEHNARHTHLNFVCRAKGVIHGLAGYFESVLYASQLSADKEPVEISILPDQIDRKSKDMISWFPIFFPLKQPLYFPQDSELEVSMWRHTDDTKVWYEWIVEAYAWVGPNTRIKVGGSELHSSRKVACLM